MRTPEEWATEVRRLPGVRSVRLVGSRATGTANALSDWDFAVETDDLHAATRAIEQLPGKERVLAAQWDPFPRDATYMLILPGAVRVDFIFPEAPAVQRPAWDPARDSPKDIETHFWDWALWLGSKELAGEQQLVREELEKMFALLLRPLGASSPARTIEEAIAQFDAWREGVEGRGLPVADPAPGAEVTAALRRARVIS